MAPVVSETHTYKVTTDLGGTLPKVSTGWLSQLAHPQAGRKVVPVGQRLIAVVGKHAPDAGRPRAR